MIAEFSAAITAITALGQTAKAVGSVLETTSDFKAKEVITNLQNGVLDLQSKVYAAQAKYQELAEVKLQIEQKLKDYEKWDSEATRYQLSTLADGIFVYALKPDQAGSEPMHYACPHCFEHKKRSILHRPSAGHTNYVCHECKFEARPATAGPITMAVPRFTPRRLSI